MTNKIRIAAIRALAVALSLSVLGTAAGAVAETAGAPARKTDGVVCPQNYLPVTGLKDGVRKRYTNRCYAMVDGATDIRRTDSQ